MGGEGTKQFVASLAIVKRRVIIALRQARGDETLVQFPIPLSRGLPEPVKRTLDLKNPIRFVWVLETRRLGHKNRLIKRTIQKRGFKIQLLTHPFSGDKERKEHSKCFEPEIRREYIIEILTLYLGEPHCDKPSF